jgi:O-antigen/teichoic acid export membrane protein
MKKLVLNIQKDLRLHIKDPLFKNAYFLIGNYVIGAALGTLLWIIVARYYTPHAVGLATALISATNLLITLSLLGLSSGVIRFLQQESDKQGMINSCLTIISLTSILIAGIFILGIGIWSPTLSFVYESPLFLLFFFILVSFSALVRLQQSIFVAMRFSEFSFFQNITLSILKIIFVLYLVELDALGIISSWAIATFIALIISTFFLTPKIVYFYKPIPTVNKRMIKEMFNISSGNYITEIIGAIPGSIYPLLIISVLSSEISAYFFIAFNISNILLMVPMAVNNSLFAEGSFSQEKFRNNAIKATKFTFLLIIPIVLGIFIFGDKLLLLFGERYAENSFYVLCVLALSVIPASVRIIYTTIANVQLKIKHIIYLYVFVTAIEITISYVLLIRIGLIGVAIGILLAEVIGALIVFAMVKKKGWI